MPLAKTTDKFKSKILFMMANDLPKGYFLNLIIPSHSLHLIGNFFL